MSVDLILAAREGDLKLFKKTLREGANIESTNDNEETALHKAFCCGRLEIVQHLCRTLSKDKLLKLLSKNDKWGSTPLHDAAWHGHLAITIPCLLESFSQDEVLELLSKNDKWGNAPLDYAAWRGHLAATILCLLEKFSKDKVLELLSIDNNREKTPLLHTAAQHGRLATTIPYFLENFPNEIVKLLYKVVKDGRLDIIKCLFKILPEETELLWSSTNNNGRTLLCCAFVHRHLEIVHFFIKERTRMNIDISARDKDGKSAFDYVSEKKHPKVLALLLSAKVEEELIKPGLIKSVGVPRDIAKLICEFSGRFKKNSLPSFLVMFPLRDDLILSIDGRIRRKKREESRIFIPFRKSVGIFRRGDFEFSQALELEEKASVIVGTNKNLKDVEKPLIPLGRTKSRSYIHQEMRISIPKEFKLHEVLPEEDYKAGSANSNGRTSCCFFVTTSEKMIESSPVSQLKPQDEDAIWKNIEELNNSNIKSLEEEWSNSRGYRALQRTNEWRQDAGENNCLMPKAPRLIQVRSISEQERRVLVYFMFSFLFVVATFACGGGSVVGMYFTITGKTLLVRSLACLLGVPGGMLVGFFCGAKVENYRNQAKDLQGELAQSKLLGPVPDVSACYRRLNIFHHSSTAEAKGEPGFTESPELSVSNNQTEFPQLCN